MGRFIVIEGLDGSGKDTQAKLLAQTVESMYKKDVKLLSFPDYDSPASIPLKMYLQGEFGEKPDDVNAYAASAFFAVDRYASYAKTWAEHHKQGGVVLANRYTTANAVHQCAKLPENQWDSFTDWLFDFEYNKMGLPEPDMVILLDVQPDISQKLLSKRYEGDESKKDIHEQDVEYLNRCRKAAHFCAQRFKWQVISCTENGQMRTKEDIAKEMKNKTAEVLK